MGKKNAKKSSSGGGKISTPACTCTDAYRCACGNRPERPSKGHKWDAETLQWTGKGHRQKGASGQTASVQKAAVTTNAGTTVAAWQRLPVVLLAEVLRQQKRPPAYFHDVPVTKATGVANNNKQSKQKLFLYKALLPDPKKDSSKSLFFIPSLAVPSSEQAKQEAALLALHHLTPSLPHERKLPEPYRTTWLNLVVQQQKKNGKETSVVAKETNGNPPAKQTNKAPTAATAQASTSLSPASAYASLADKRKDRSEKRKTINQKIRRHEAIRMANAMPQVFMSASMRKKIEALLRNETDSRLLLNDDNADDEKIPKATVEVQFYVENRLHTEGFTKKQARTAYEQNQKSSTTSTGENDEDQWDMVYEECLQWLLVHVDEDQLPEGFDPRGSTLDVVVPTTTATTGSASTDSVSGAWTTELGLAGVDIQRLNAATKRSNNTAVEDTLWKLLHQASGVVPPDKYCECEASIWEEEKEALEAIFADDCTISSLQEEQQHVQVQLPDVQLSLHVILRPGVYPAEPPYRVWVKGKWPQPVGAAVHVKLIEFMTEELSRGDPMIFALHGQLIELLETLDDLKSPFSAAPVHPKPNSTDKRPGENKGVESKRNSQAPIQRQRRRKRVQRPFWSRLPLETPTAIGFPPISSSLARTRNSLPAAGARSEFLEKLKQAGSRGRVLLVTGDTGCGKTTQIPQYILEENPSTCKIVVAQPRRLAATGVATRVASERGESSPGKGSIGYVVRGDSALCEQSRLVFCTTGILLRQMQSADALRCVTHIVVDEIHERNIDSDIFLGIMKQMLPQYPHLNVILMSATLDADKFAAYWGKETPRIHIPGRTFPVQDFTLSDVLRLTGYIPRKNKKGKSRRYKLNSRSTPWADSEKSDDELDDSPEEPQNVVDSQQPSHQIPIEELVERVDETDVDFDMIGRLVRYIVSQKSANDDGSVLVFLSGAPEISKAIDAIRAAGKGVPLVVLPLHGGLQSKEQHRVFNPVERGFTKVIVSTNVAETSITIPDCTVVIDSAREKQSSYDPANRMPLLVEHFASKASLKQRRGRAGRVRQGTCYKLISEATLDRLSEHGEPEIQRCALEQTLLSLLFLGLESGSGTFMKTLLDPPSKASLDAAILSLLQIGAVDKVGLGGDLELTPLGLHLAGIPAPPAIGKMLVMGCILGCRSAALAMAAGMSAGRSPLLRVDAPRNRGQETMSFQAHKDENVLVERKKLFEEVGSSDHAFLAALYARWECTDTGGGQRKRVCDQFGLAFTGMRDIGQLVRQLSSSLSSLGFDASNESDRNGKSWRIIRSCAVASLAPSQLVKVVRPAITYHETAEGAKELDGKARELKFFIRNDSASREGSSAATRDIEERVFIHPSSANFATGSYSCPWLVYHSMVRTSKPFLRDVTECNVYPLLLFGGKLEVQASNETVVIDQWVKLSANARIASLMGGLRKRVDVLLTRKIEDTRFELASTTEMKLIVKLVTTDGLGSA